jgi:PIN domain nuclease of toxin-antitoxin system
MIVLDTHALIWWLAEPAKLSAAARKIISDSAAKGVVGISTASILEVATLVRRKRLVLTTSVEEWLDDVRQLPELDLLPITAEIAARAGSFEENVHGDPIDRLIIATALAAKAKLVTADKQIRSLAIVNSVW